MASITLSAETSTSARTLRQILNITLFGTVITVNALANIIPFNDQTTGELSDGFNSLVTPAGYVFSIWGLIYTLLAVFVVYQALPSQKENRNLDKLGYTFVWSCIFNVAWIFSWHFNQFLLSELCMLGLLISLIVAYVRLGIGQQKDLSVRERVATHLPFSIYLGWITAATILNTTVLLLSIGFTGGAYAPLFGVAMIIAAAIIGFTVLLRHGDFPYTMVLVWAFIGIAVAESGITPIVVTTAILAAIVIFSVSLAQVARRKAMLLA